MVQPFNYSLPGAVSPFESVVQGLKLGATMEELAAARAQRTAQAEALRRKEQEERRRMDLVSALAAKPLNQWTSQDIVNASGTFPKEQLSFLQSRMDALSSEEKQRLASETGQAVTVALSGSRAAVNDWFDPRISAESDPNKRRQLEVQKQAALNAPEQFAKTYIPYLGQLGDAGKTVADNLFKMLPQLAGVKENWAPVPPDQIKAWGWAAGTQAVRNTTTGEIKGVGSGGTVVNLKNEGPIPADHTAERDAQGNIIGYKVIPGSPTDIKRKAEATASTARAEGQVQTTGIILDDIQRVVKALDEEEALSGAARLDPFKQVTGLGGKFATSLPGSARVTTQGIIDTIKANIGFEQLAKMRAESPTGGALGNITEQELKFLQATLGSLDLDLEPKILRQNLRRLQTIYSNIMQKASGYPNAAQYGFAQQPATAPVVGTVPSGGVGAVQIEPVSRPAPPALVPAPARPAGVAKPSLESIFGPAR